MAGHDQGKRIPGQGGAHGPGAIMLSYVFRDKFVGADPSAGDLGFRPKNRFLER